MTYLKAVEAGVDVIDCAISPFALGTSQPATEVMVETFKGTCHTGSIMCMQLDRQLGCRLHCRDHLGSLIRNKEACHIFDTDRIRIFDCLNDLRNLQEAVNATNKVKAREGRGHAQVALSYTLGDAYTMEYWMGLFCHFYFLLLS